MTVEFDRRPLLKVLGAGTALSLLPKSWTRPVVQSIVVPAHATASPGTTTTTSGTPTPTSTST
jgi:hypothetical protein